MRDRLKLMWLDGELDQEMPVESRRKAVRNLRAMAEKTVADSTNAGTWEEQPDLLLMLGAALDDPDEEVGRIARQALVTIGSEKATPLLRNSLASVEGCKRRGAAAALTAFGETEWEACIEGDGDDFLRAGRQHPPEAAQVMFRALQDPDHAELRAMAARGLGELGDREAVPPLLGALSDWKVDVKAQAAEALGKIGDERAVQPLVEAAKDDNEKLRSGAQSGLRHLGEPAVEPLVGLLGDGDRNVRRRAASSLSALGEIALEPLRGVLQEGSANERGAAVEALGILGDPRALGALVAHLEDQDGDVRIGAIDALAELGEADAIEPLLAALSDPEGPARRKAAQALERMGEPDWKRWFQGYADDFIQVAQSDDRRTLAILRKALSRQEGPALANAARSLGKLGDIEALSPLIGTLENPDAGVREAAVEAISQLGDEAVEPLASIFQSPEGKSPDVLGEVALALGKLGNHQALIPLLGALGADEGSLRARAAEALGSLGERDAISALIDTLCASEGAVRRSAALALNELGDRSWRLWIQGDDDDFKRLGRSDDPRAVDVLLSVLGQGPDSGLRSKIVDALGRLGGDRALEKLTELLGGDDEEARQNVIEAFGQMGDKRAIDTLVPVLTTPQGELRRGAARALKRLGESELAAKVNGDSEDFLRLAETGDRRLREGLQTFLESLDDDSLKSALRAILDRSSD